MALIVLSGGMEKSWALPDTSKSLSVTDGSDIPLESLSLGNYWTIQGWMDSPLDGLDNVAGRRKASDL